MANRNQKITSINSAPRNPKTGFTKDEKTALFMTLGQIAMDLDRLIRINGIDVEKDEDFYDPANGMVTDMCYSLIEGYYPELVNDNGDDNEE